MRSESEAPGTQKLILAMSFNLSLLALVLGLLSGCLGRVVDASQRTAAGAYWQAFQYASAAWRPTARDVGGPPSAGDSASRLLKASWTALQLASRLQRVPEVTDVSAMCSEDLRTLGGAIRRGELWAMAFVDSVGKPQAGLLNGATVWLGSFDQCLHAAALNSSKQPLGPNFSGAYCLLKLGPPSGSGNSSGAAEKPLKYVVRVGTTITLGTCWPDSCTVEDAATVATALLRLALPDGRGRGLVEAASVGRECHTASRRAELSPVAITLLSLLGAVGACLLAGTAIDLYQRSAARSANAAFAADAARISPNSTGVDDGLEPGLESSGNGGDEEALMVAAISRDNAVLRRLGLLKEILLCFSIRANAVRILQRQTGSLQCANGVRFLSMSWIVLGHTYYVGLIGASNLGQLLPQWLNDWTFQAVLNATLAVDTFFLLSGLLATFLFLQELDRRGQLRRINWVRFYLHRYLRLTIPYIAVLGIYATIAQYLWDGPRYPIEGFDRNCDTNWWRNLLYINNLWSLEEMCLPWSWYLANDMQFYVLSPLVLIPLAWKPALGVALAAAVILASVTALGVHSTQTGMRAGLLTDEVYTRPWFRVGPYLVGSLAGFAAHRLFQPDIGRGGGDSRRFSGARYRLHWTLRLLGWAVAIGLCASAIYGLFNVTRGRVELSQPIASLYNCLFRLAWSVGVAMVILACATCNGGIASEILSAWVFGPLSRLSYCVYLIHPALITAVETARRDSLQWNAWTPIGNFLAYLLASYVIAFAASLALESPLISLERLATIGVR